MVQFKEWAWSDKERIFALWKEFIESLTPFTISWDVIRIENSPSFVLDWISFNPEKFDAGLPISWNVVVKVKWEYTQRIMDENPDMTNWVAGPNNTMIWSGRKDHKLMRTRLFARVPNEDVLSFYFADSQGLTMLAGILGDYWNIEPDISDGSTPTKLITAQWFKNNYGDLDLPMQFLEILNPLFEAERNMFDQKIIEQNIDEEIEMLQGLDPTDELIDQARRFGSLNELEPDDPEEVMDDNCREHWGEYFKWRQLNQDTPIEDFPRYEDLVSCNRENRDRIWYHTHHPGLLYIVEGEFLDQVAGDISAPCEKHWLNHLEWIEVRRELELDSSENLSPFFGVIEICISRGFDKAWFAQRHPIINARVFGVENDQL